MRLSVALLLLVATGCRTTPPAPPSPPPPTPAVSVDAPFTRVRVQNDGGVQVYAPPAGAGSPTVSVPGR
jgi:hypothetical protein